MQGNSRRFSAGAVTRRLLATNKAVLFAIVFGIYLTFASPYFLTATNLGNLAQQIAALTVVALAFTMILGEGDIDLSLGGIIGLVGIIMGKLIQSVHMPWLAAILVGLVIGSLCGALNAGLVSRFGLPPFIVTLATNALFTGGIYILSQLVPITINSNAFNAIGNDYYYHIPISVLILIPIAVAFWVMVRWSVFSQHVIAVGGSADAVRVAGINISRVRMKVFVLEGACCAVASVFITSQASSAQIGAGSDQLLLVIAAVVIGGTPLLGGRVQIIGTIFGCIIIGMINNGLDLLGINANYQTLTQGLLILLALLVDVQSTRLLLAMAKRGMLQREQGMRRPEQEMRQPERAL